MIAKLIRKILKLDENDREIELLQKKAKKQIDEATLVLERAGKVQRTMVRKTTTFYIGKSMGVIK